MSEEQEWKSLSTLDKIEHKNWNARLEGYKEALKEMNNARDSKDPLFNQYLGVMKKMIVDNNVVAQEKALEVVLLFVEEANVAGKVAGELCTGLVTKCISSIRAKTRDNGVAVMKMLIEIEKQDVVIEELLKGLGNKAPKVVLGCITVLKEALHEFGPKVISIKELFKVLPQLLDDRDKGVRDGGKDLVIEIYRWIGRPAMTPQLNNFKPIQVTELNLEFDKLPPEKAVPTRYLKSQKPKVMPQTNVNNGGIASNNAANVVAPEQTIDPYEFIEPVEVISKIPNDFYDKIEEKKWTDRKDAMEVIEKLTDNEKIVPGDFGELMKVLLKVLSKDSNVVLVVLAGKIIYQIAHGLRKKFSPYAVLTIQTCLEKFKEKKANVVKYLRDCTDAAFFATNLDSIAEDVINALGHKTPSVKSETCLFLNRIFMKCTMDTLPKKQLKTFIPPVVKLCQDSVPEVREASFQVISTAIRVVTEKNMKLYLESIDSVKMARIMELVEKCKTEVEQTPVIAVPVKVAEPPKDVKPKNEKAVAAKGAPKKVMGGQKTQKKATNVVEIEIPKEPIISDEDVTTMGTELLGEEFMNQIISKDFKERILAVQCLQNFIKNKSGTEIPSQLIVKLILLKPGLKDNNVQVLKSKLEVIKEVVINGKFTLTVCELCIVDVIEKIGDIKNSENVKSILIEMSDALNFQCVASHVIKVTSESIIPKNIIEGTMWISEAIKLFGFKVDMKELVPFIKVVIQHTAANVRQAAIKLVGTVSLYVRDVIATLLKDEKPQTKLLIDQEVENMKSVEPPLPTRGLKNSKAGSPDETDCGIASEPVHVEIDRDELIPRENISGKITDDLLGKLTDKSLKIKKEALEEIGTILDKCSGIVGDGLQPVLAVIAKTTSDPSKVIGKICLTLLSIFCKLLPKKDAEKFVKVLVPALFAYCSDAKPKNREDAISTLNTWIEKVGFGAVAEGGMIIEALKVDSPFQKAEILSWISPHLTHLSENKSLKKSLPPDFSAEILPCVYTSLEERNPDVRKKAQESLLPFMLVFGYDEMMKVYNRQSKGSSKDNIKTFIDNTKELLPAQEVTANKPEVKSQSISNVKKESTNKKSDEGSVNKLKKEDAKKMSKGKIVVKEAEVVKPEEIMVPLLQKNNNKKQRLIEDSKKKNLNKAEISQLINTQFTAVANQKLMVNLFSTDFKKHIVALEMLSKFVTEDNAYSLEATKQNLDLILKWIVIRFDETNPSMVNKGLEYLTLLFTILSKENFSLDQQEATNFLPDFILKLGDPNNNIRTNVSKILKLLLLCYPPKNIIPFIERVLFETKAAKVKGGCSEFCQSLIDEEKIRVADHASLLIAISKLIKENDNSIRTAALNCLVSAHNYMGDPLHKLLKELNEKERSMLLERIKRTGKALTPAPEAATGPPEKIIKSSRELTSSRELVQTQSGTLSNQVSQHKPVLSEVAPIVREEFRLKLINVDEDIKELLQPVEKITLRFSGRTSQTVNSNDAITAVIHSINSNDVQTSIQAMAQIDEVIKNQDVRPQLLTYMDNLVMSITMQLKATLGKLSEENFNESEITDMFKGMLASLMSIFSHADLAAELNRDRLMNLMQVILRLVINDQLVALSEGCTIIRGINILSVRILESSNQTRMLSSLLRMMMDCLRNNDLTSKYLQLIFKCIWSMTKNLSNTVNSIDLVVILKDIHTFYNDFPPHIWQAPNTDVPMRTVKTIVYSIISHKSSGVLEALYQIPNAPGKDLEQYIRKSYAKLHYSIPEVLPTAVAEVKDTVPISRTVDTQKNFIAKSNSRPYLDELKLIFQKIGNPTENKEGLNDLYDFKIKYNNVDLSRYLNQTTPYFQKTIDNGLKVIAEERGQPMPTLTTTNNLNTASTNKNDYMSYCDMDPDTLLRRLKDLRIQAGLDKPKSEVVHVPTSPHFKDDMEISVIGNLNPSGDGPNLQVASQPLRRMSANDLNAFRQRLNLYKNPR